MVHSHNSGSALRILFKLCAVKGAMVGARYMKIV